MVASGLCAMRDDLAEELETYRMLSNGKGRLHLTAASEGWLVPGQNPFGLYFYLEDVDKWAAEFRDLRSLARTLRKISHRRGAYEFAVSDPDQTLVLHQLAKAAFVNPPPPDDF